MHNILITGGAGFIGSHFARYLDTINANYLILDNLSNGSLDSIPEAVSRNRFVYGDVSDTRLVKKLIDSSWCVIHMASVVGVRNVLRHPLDLISTDINSLRFIARSCAEKNVKLVYFSSSLVYSAASDTLNQDHTYSEEREIHTLGLNSVSMYVYAKMTGELICRHYYDTMGLNYLILRPFNMIGVRQRSCTGMVIPSLIRSALQSGVINIFGTGEQKRSFSDVQTAVKLLWQLVNNDSAGGEIINLATTDKSVSINELAEMIITVLGKKIVTKKIGYEEAYGCKYTDVLLKAPSLSRLKKHVSPWQERNLKDIIREIIEYEREILPADKPAVIQND